MSTPPITTRRPAASTAPGTLPAAAAFTHRADAGAAMPSGTGPAPAGDSGPAVPTPPAPRAGRFIAVLMMLGTGLSTQVGASLGAMAFPVVGPVGVVAVRQWVAGVVLVAVGRPRLRELTARQWRLVLGLATVFAVMNLSLYLAIDRVGLGLAVTLEFLGPLAVALLGSRRVIDLVCALAVAPAVVLLTRPQATTDYLGVGLGLLAALCWACYILLNRRIGRELPGVQGVGAAAAVSGLVYVPIGVVVLWHHPPTPAALAYAVAAGVLSSAVPFLVDLLALRRVSAQFFGVFMSVNPVLAAVVGLVVLGQRLGHLDWFAIGVIVTANAVALSAGGRGRSRRGSSPRVRRSSRRALHDLDPTIRKGGRATGSDGLPAEE